MSGLYLNLSRHGKLLARQVQQGLQISQSARCLSVVQGDLNRLAPKVRAWVEKNAKICQPDNIHICDGSDAEEQKIRKYLTEIGLAKPLPKYKNCAIVHTDPADVARVESKTVISTPRKRDTIPTPAEGVKGKLGYWWSPEQMKEEYDSRFPGCMKGRTMYVIPFSMGPVGSPLAKVGIQCTDSAYVVNSMKIMTRMGTNVLESLGTGDFINCLHSVGAPLPLTNPLINNWPCNPKKVMIAHVPERNEIVSYGSGYGGNSLLGKKCFALRLGSILAHKEGWLAEHMLILGITNPKGVKKYIAAAFPSACGKTNLAMMVPNLPGWKVECVGDDIAWMKFDEEGRLRAINPEYGFFGVAPGTSHITNPNAMETLKTNSIFTNVAETEDGGFFWEGLEDEVNLNQKITSWLGQEWTPDCGKKAAHANSRFCTPASQCPMMDADWENPRGVPIEAILFGGRRPQGVPLVYEAFDWNHGVFIGASVRSEATAAAEHKAGKVVMHDPFAMRPFFGYNFGDYMQHWLDMKNHKGAQLPKIFHVNWFRKNDQGKFIWPGFGENARVLEWVFHRLDGQDVAEKSAIGYIPKKDTINIDGLGPIDMDELFRLPKEFWQNECKEIRKYFDEQVPQDLPAEVANELNTLEERVNALK